MDLTFNIVYTPGTVKYLSLFVHSLLKWSDCAFRLVSNGCLPPERRYLQQLCLQHPRLTYWTIPTKSALPHDLALNYLHGMTHTDHFCFMDSDMFATGDFISPITSRLKDHAVVFSGATLWLNKTDETLPAAFRIMSGLHHRSDTGICLGSSYFACYDNRVLTDFIQETGIGFDTYQWDEIPPPYQEQLREMGLEKDSYDTGKILNLLVQQWGHSCMHLDIPELCHLGGVSFIPRYEKKTRSVKSRLAERLAHGPLKTAWSAHQTKLAYGAFGHLTSGEYEAIVSQRRDQRDPVRRYFFHLLKALFDNKPLPERPDVGVAEIDRRVKTAAEQIIALHKAFGRHM